MGISNARLIEVVYSINDNGFDKTKKLFNLSDSTLRRYIRDAKRRGLVRGDVSLKLSSKKDIIVPEIFKTNTSTPLMVEGDAVIVGDIHCPTVDYEFASLVVKVAKKMKVKQLIIAGDFFNMDCFSSYMNITTLPTWQDEIQAFNHLLASWKKYFKNIYVFLGNH